MTWQEAEEVPAEQAFVDPGDMSLGHYVLGQAEAGDRIAVVDHSRGGQRDHTPARRSVANSVVVAVLTENNAQFVILYHRVLAAGAVPLDPRGREVE